MTAHYCVRSIILSTLFSISVARPFGSKGVEREDDDAKVDGAHYDNVTLHYLTLFGYLPKHQIVMPDYVENSIRLFQKYAGLEQTGELNNDTRTMMDQPRCGIPDVRSENVDINSLGGVYESDLPTGSSVRKRYALYGTKWHKSEISYCIVNYPRPRNKESTPAERDAEKLKFARSVATAVLKWTSVIPLKIASVDCSMNPEIRVQFEEGYHKDRFKFDGKGGVLAHAFFPSKRKHNAHPYTGDVHLDLDEDWVNEGQRKGTCFPYVFSHELGHSLGLTHSTSKNSLMWPFYIPCYKEIRLQEDDIKGIQAIYGVPKKQDLGKRTECHESEGTFASTREAQSYCASVDRQLCSRKDLQLVIEHVKDLYLSDWYWVRDGLPTKAKVDATTCQKMGETENGGCFYDKLLISTDVGSQMKALCCAVPVKSLGRDPRREDTLCGGVFDAMVRIRAPLMFDQDRLYSVVFKEKFVYAFDVFGMATGFPAKIKDRFPSFDEPYVCSAIVLPRGLLETNLILFGRDKYYVYDVQETFNLFPGYPKPFKLWALKGFGECPGVVFALKDQINFIRGERVWKYTGAIGEVSPVDMKDEILTPLRFNWSSIVSAATWKPGALFFFDNKGEYYYCRNRQFMRGYPKVTAKAWFHFCP